MHAPGPMERTRQAINAERAAELRDRLEDVDPIEKSEMAQRLRRLRAARRVPARWRAYHGQGEPEAS